MAFDPKKAKEALESAERLLKASQDTDKATKNIAEGISAISGGLFNLSGSEFFKKVPKTSEDFANQLALLKEISVQLEEAARHSNDVFRETDFGKALSELKVQFKSAGDIFSEGIKNLGLSADEINKISNAIGGYGKIGGKNEQEALNEISKSLGGQVLTQKQLDDIIKEHNKSLDEQAKYLATNSDEIRKILESENALVSLVGEEEAMRIANSLVQKDLSDFVAEEGEHMVAILKSAGLIDEAMESQLRRQVMLTNQFEEARNRLKETEKDVFSIGNGLKGWAKNILSINSLMAKIVEFDQLINDTQRDTGINFDRNTIKMSLLTSKTAEFGMTTAETFQTMAALGDELKTTDFDVLAKATGDMSAIQKATGVSSENMAKIAGEMMRMGKSSDDVRVFMGKANANAKMFGVSSKKVLEDVAKNLGRMRQMGFVGGEESLARMAAQANRLRMNVDEIFNVAERARTIEGALNMAAELQLAGGSFANINPMDLLASARKGPEELNKILSKMGGDIGNFDKDNKFVFDPVDADRLRIVAEATGMELDSLQNMISKNAEDNRKLNMLPEDMFNMDNFKPEEVKAQISDALQIDEKSGETIIKKGSFLDKAGIKDVGDLKNMSKEQIKKMLEGQQAEAKNLEEQARQNESLKDSFNNLISSVTAMMTIIQPFLEMLTVVFTTLNKWFQAMPDWAKLVVGGLMTVFAFHLAGMKLLNVNLLGGLKDVFSGGANMLKSAGNGLKKILGMGGQAPGTQQNAASSTQGVTGQQSAGFKDFLKNIREGLVDFGKDMAGVLKGALTLSLAVVMIGGALAGITLAFAALGGDFTQLVLFGLAILELSGAFFLMSKVAKGISMKDVLLMSLSMFIIGAALIPFALSAQMFSGVDWGSVLIALGLLTLVILGLTAIGALMSTGAIGFLLLGVGSLILVGLGLLLFSASMLTFGAAMKEMATIPWDSLTAIGPSVLSIIPALLGFAAAGLVFINPFMTLGMATMIGLLGSLAAVMIPLGDAFHLAGDGMTAFVNGMEKLESAVANLNLEKLDKFREMSESLSTISAPSVSIPQQQSSQYAQGGSTKRVEHIVKILFNGKEMQQLILDDTELQT